MVFYKIPLLKLNSIWPIGQKKSSKKKRRAGYELKPARQAKRKEADATGPQGGYGIRLACPPIRAKGMPNTFLASLFLYIYAANLHNLIYFF